MNGSCQADGLAGEFESLQLRASAARIALIEDQVKHVQHGTEPLGPLLAGRQLEWHAGSLDALLGPADALRHGRLGNQERAGDFRCGQAAHRPQRQGDRR